MRPRGRYVLRHYLVQVGHGLNGVAVALYLIRPHHHAHQLAAVLRGIAQGFGYKRGGLVAPYGVAYGVITAWVEHHFKRQAVVVGRRALAFFVYCRLLEEQLACPAVKRPHKERRGRAAAFYLHTPFVAEIRCTPASGCRYQVAFFAPHGHRAGCYLRPAFHLGHAVVSAGDLRVGQVVVVCQKHLHGCRLLVVQHLGRVLILKLAANHALVARRLKFGVLHAQAARRLRQAVRPAVAQARQGGGGLCPELPSVHPGFALSHAVAVRPVQHLPECPKHRAVIGILFLLLRRQVPPVAQYVVGIILHRLAVWLHALHKWLAFGLLFQVRKAAVNLRAVLHGQAFNLIERTAAITCAAYLLHRAPLAHFLQSRQADNAR